MCMQGERAYGSHRAIPFGVDIGDPPSDDPGLPPRTLQGGRESWLACQQVAQKHREHANGIAAPSASLDPGTASGWRVDGGLRLGPGRDGTVFVLPGRRPDIIGWGAAIDGLLDRDLPSIVRYFQRQEPDR